MKKVVFFLLAIVVANTCAFAQSYHFSQFYTAPLLNNPALTGNINGPYRIAANFRSQWIQGGTPYQTGTLSMDFSPLRDRLAEGSRLGIGVVIVNDQSSGGALQTNTLGVSAAYNLSLGYDGTHAIGVGLQGTFQQRRIDITKLSFENQYGVDGYDESIPVIEMFGELSKNYIDVGAGLLYKYNYEGITFFAGVGGYNLLQHKNNLLPESYRIPMRLTIMGGGQTEVGYAGTLYFSGMHMKQGTANVTTIGGAYRIGLGEVGNKALSVGIWHRLGDALIPYIGYQINAVKAGISYDYTIIKAKTGNGIKNGYELSLIYEAEDKSDLKRLIPWY